MTKPRYIREAPALVIEQITKLQGGEKWTPEEFSISELSSMLIVALGWMDGAFTLLEAEGYTDIIRKLAMGVATGEYDSATDL